MIGLYIGLAFPVGMSIVGAVYALYFDPKSTLPRGTLARLR